MSLRAKDKKELESLLRKGSLPVKVYKRAMALLELNKGKSLGRWLKHGGMLSVGLFVVFGLQTGA